MTRNGWSGSDRKETLPANWEYLRQRTFKRDGYRCVATTIDGTRCRETKNLECDHVGARDNHELSNLRTLCHWHHLRRSSGQGGRAAAQAQRKRRVQFRRPEEQLPAYANPGSKPPWMKKVTNAPTDRPAPEQRLAAPAAPQEDGPGHPRHPHASGPHPAGAEDLA